MRLTYLIVQCLIYLQYNYLPGDFPDTAKVWLEDDIKSICNKVTKDFALIKNGMNAAYIAGDGYVAVAWSQHTSVFYPAECDISSCHLALSGCLSMNKLGRGVPENSNGYKILLSGNLGNDLPLIPGYWIDSKNFLSIHSQIVNRAAKVVDLNIVPEGNSILLIGKNKGISHNSNPFFNSY